MPSRISRSLRFSLVCYAFLLIAPAFNVYAFYLMESGTSLTIVIACCLAVIDVKERRRYRWYGVLLSILLPVASWYVWCSVKESVRNPFEREASPSSHCRTVGEGAPDRIC